MKKFLSIVLALAVIFSFTVMGNAKEDKTLKFGDDGKFKIMQINDTQDVGKGVDERMVKFIEAALDKEQPDLVVFAGDQLSDMYPFGTVEDMTLAIANIIKPLEERNIPFLVTMGNHDHDHTDKFSVEAQFNAYNAYSNCYMTENGPDKFTCNIPVMSSDGKDIAFNVYVMNTNNKAQQGGYAGVKAEQIEWYKDTSAALKAQNDGKTVPSMLFQHVPPKEIYSLLKECDYKTEGAVYAQRDNKWYVIDETKAEGKLGEAPCSEDFDNITGQYESWLECGDIMGAFFAHDHVNTFVGTTDDGIKMGYNGGTGFRTYGNSGERSVRIFEYEENDVKNYSTRILTYNEATGENLGFVITDLFTPALLTTLMKVVYTLFGWMM